MDPAPIVLARLTLRPLTEDAADGPYQSWLGDPEVVQYLESRFATHSRDDVAAYIRAMNEAENTFLFGIFVTESGDHVGNIKLGPIDRRHSVGDVGLLIGAKKHWGKGFATEAIRGLTRWALEELGLHKLTAGCYHVNEGSLRAFLKAGWTEEGRRPEQYQLGDRRVDGILLGYVKGES